MFLNQENRNRKQKRVFPTFQDKKHILIFWMHQKRRKRETELKRRIKKKKRVIKRETIFHDTEKDQTWKKKPKRKGNRENEVFLEVFVW